jgi:O-acetyl-ADP-ribose deacetylase (regulator of RNase III)
VATNWRSGPTPGRIDSGQGRQALPGHSGPEDTTLRHIKLTIGDLTTANADAIINAANPAMLGGGGVDGALHRAAGPALLQACRQVEVVDGIRCPVGEARITGAGDLRARYVIHAVGPRYGLDPQPARLLAASYRSSFLLAREHGCDSIAAPAISCGVYGYPLQEAARVALRTAGAPEFADLAITFYLFDQAIFDQWNAVFSSLVGNSG